MQLHFSPRAAWYAYDWANSAFSTTVVTVFFGPFITSVANSVATDAGLPIFGWHIHTGAWFSFVVTVSVIAQVAILPVLGAYADRSGKKKVLLGVTAFIGALATMAMYGIQASQGNVLTGGLLFLVANVCFGASIVVYNAFLPEVSPEDERDAVSSRGWAVGYLGGGLLLLAHLVMYSSADEFPGGPEHVVRIIIASAGVWWALFTIIPMVFLPKGKQRSSHVKKTGSSIRQLVNTFRHMRLYPQTLLFLIAYLFYNDAVQTVLTMASVFGQEELGLGLATLTSAILLVQFVAIGGSLGFEQVARKFSAKTAILIALVGWMFVLVAAATIVQTATHFYILAGIIALVMGGTQALSRSLFSKLVPKGSESEYFAFYEISDKGTSWIGTFLFGVALTTSGSYRWAIFSLIVLVLVGGILLARVNVQEGIEQARAS